VRVIGLISGTSADGIDAAVVDIVRQAGEVCIHPLAWLTLPIPDDLRARIFGTSDPQIGRVDDVCRLDALLGEWFARAARAVAEKAAMTLDEVDLIASHGQTIYHAVGRDEEPPSTLQIGEPAVIAERTGRTVVADFRPRDVAAGGQGAPLAPYVDYLLFADARVARAVQNIGGIANVTYIPTGANRDDVIAFDTGPGNMVLDALARALYGRPFDRDGEIATKGRIDEELLGVLLADPFYAAPPPKSTGREHYGAPFVEELRRRAVARGLRDEDLLATATALTVRSIANGYRRFLARVDEVIVSGGGADNQTLTRWLADAVRTAHPHAIVRRSDDLGVPSKAKEAIIFAVLGYETIHGRTGTLPGSTGASRAVVLGTIVPGSNYLKLVRQVAAPAMTGKV
jgi:anhydro-N-acetylmuramic acid kinase